MFMMGLCASCHAGMLREPAVAARGEVPGLLQAAEVVIAVPGEGQPAAVRATSGGAYTPDITTLATKIKEGPLYTNVYFTGGSVRATMPRMLADGVLVCQELKKKMSMQFARPYMAAFMAA
ncbi:hypothetical protein ACQ4PT_004144 [Festuca glaucescens]